MLVASPAVLSAHPILSTVVTQSSTAQPGSPRRLRWITHPRSTSATAANTTPSAVRPDLISNTTVTVQNNSPKQPNIARRVSALRAGVDPPNPAVGS